MKKYKLLILPILAIILSGCTFEYNIEITEDNIKEDNTVFLNNATENTVSKDVENLVNKYTGPTNSLGMYSASIVEKNSEFGMSYKSSYQLLEYNHSVTFSLCYDLHKIIKEKDKIIIATSKEFKCFDKYEELDNVTVNLTTDLNVESSNADIVNGNKYTWYINKYNASDKEINITLKTKNSLNEKREKTIGAFILVVSAFILFGIIVFIIRSRGKRKNKI